MNYQFYVAIASVLIATFAFLGSIWNALETRRYFRLSATPMLQFHNNLGWDGNLIGIRLENAGVGPAIITGFQIMCDGIRLPTNNLPSPDWFTALKEVDRNYPWLSFEVPGLGTFIPPGQKLNILVAEKGKIPESKQGSFVSALVKIDVQVSYESVYHEKHEASLRKTTRKEI